jgi:hypothetical protein
MSDSSPGQVRWFVVADDWFVISAGPHEAIPCVSREHAAAVAMMMGAPTWAIEMNYRLEFPVDEWLQKAIWRGGGAWLEIGHAARVNDEFLNYLGLRGGHGDERGGE